MSLTTNYPQGYDMKQVQIQYLHLVIVNGNFTVSVQPEKSKIMIWQDREIYGYNF